MCRKTTWQTLQYRFSMFFVPIINQAFNFNAYQPMDTAVV